MSIIPKKYVFNLTKTGNYIYVIYTSHMAKLGLPIIKYGKTRNVMNRFKGYPKDSVILYLCKVNNCHHVKDNIFTAFKEHFKQETYYGKEYFSGESIRDMIYLIDQLITFMNQRVNEDFEPIIKSYGKYVTFKICNNDEPNDYLDALDAKFVDNTDKQKMKYVSNDTESNDVKNNFNGDSDDDQNNSTNDIKSDYDIKNEQKVKYVCKHCHASFMSKFTMYRHIRLDCKENPEIMHQKQ
jgi:hypothetical protein